MEDLDPPRVRREARDRDEVDRDVDVGNGAGEVREEDQRTLEHADEDHAAGMITRDLGAEPFHVTADRRFVEKDARRHVS